MNSITTELEFRSPGVRRRSGRSNVGARGEQQNERQRREHQVERDAAGEEEHVVFPAVVPHSLGVIAKRPAEAGERERRSCLATPSPGRRRYSSTGFVAIAAAVVRGRRRHRRDTPPSSRRCAARAPSRASRAAARPASIARCTWRFLRSIASRAESIWSSTRWRASSNVSRHTVGHVRHRLLGRSANASRASLDVATRVRARLAARATAPRRRRSQAPIRNGMTARRVLLDR